MSEQQLEQAKRMCRMLEQKNQRDRSRNGLGFGRKRCWRCGKETELQRCHLIPDSLGGKDEASNIVLLCDKCHKEGPNVADPEIMWDWIKAYAQPNQFMFLFYQISREYEFIYKRSIKEEIKFFQFLQEENIKK